MYINCGFSPSYYNVLALQSTNTADMAVCYDFVGLLYLLIYTKQIGEILQKSSKKKLPGHPPTNIQELSHHKDFAFVLCHVADKNSFLAYDRKHVIEDKWNLYGASMKPSTLKNAAIFTFHEHGHSKNGGRGLSYSSDPYMGLEVKVLVVLIN